VNWLFWLYVVLGCYRADVLDVSEFKIVDFFIERPKLLAVL
jgi:hypothetical protein